MPSREQSLPPAAGTGGDPQTLARLSVINKVSAAALAHPSVADIYRVVAEAIVEHFSYFEASVFEVRAADGQLVLVAQSPPRELSGEPPYSQSVGEGLIGLAFRERQSVLVNDVARDPRFVPPPHCPPHLAAELCAPVLHDGRVAAVIDVECCKPEAFGESDRLALEAIANVVGLALHAAEVHSTLEHQLEQLRAARCDLLQSERLADVGRLTSRVAHEIRNPLATIGGFGHRILATPDLDPKAQRYATIIVEEVERLERLLGGIMSFVSPRLPEKVTADVNAILLRAVELCHDHCGDKHITCQKHLNPDLPQILADPAQIEQVFINILKNAIDSIADVGTVTLLSQRAGSDVVVRIADTGAGIDPDHLANIFDPFFTTKPGGTGLGLAVASKIVDDHGGRLLLGSELGKGTHVSIRLPIGSAPDPALEAVGLAAPHRP
jgi:signal transduction histidine kinase